MPVTIVTGLFGSGKTTLINRIIEYQGDVKFAVLVSEAGEIDLNEENIIIVEYDLRCPICGKIDCKYSLNVNESLIHAVYRILEEEKVDYLIIETTGLADPLPIALTILGTELRNLTRLDSIITVIDSYNFSLDLFDNEAVFNQITYGDIILLNKTDLVNSSDLEILESRIRELKQDARILHSYQGLVPLSLISEPTWNKLHQDVSQDEELSSVSLFSFESGKSFSVEKFQYFLNNQLSESKSIFRVVGILWFKESPQKHIFHLSGKRFALTDHEWKDDKKNQLVFFGQNIDREILNSQLRNCLSEDIEL